MKTDKYKILVLSDLKKTASTTLESSVSLANMINAEIELFYVKKQIEIVKGSKSSKNKAIKEEDESIKKKIETLIDPISRAYNIAINYKYSQGKLKVEILKRINDYKPDVIVLGQRDSSPLQLIGDSVTQFVLKKFNGNVLIAANENALVPNEKVSLGVLDGSCKIFKTKFHKGLMAHTKTPLKSFKVIKTQNEEQSVPVSKEVKTVEYVFEKNPNTITTLSSYLLKSNINLLCVDRAENNSKKFGEISLREVVNKLKVSLLVS
ncbi:universal stress protein [Aureibaculum marinum]|uniref:Universal stress protein n=1 Tax=Aureibaculum marinum TaxID=2487930 RepID=A0A3N4NK36_9FLAO|nr:universal stress protein [Aureibaculum marinum]RPD96571.1 universal stress protein [Aureibaculum marinum]